MTREEAIQVLKEISTTLKSWSGFTKYPQAIDMAIEALQADRPTHERDLISRHEALMELNGACEMWEDDAIVADIIHKLPSIEIVRCKDCRHCEKCYDTDGCSYWICNEWDSGTGADGFCHYGERKHE